jgi:hypothetical protein
MRLPQVMQVSVELRKYPFSQRLHWKLLRQVRQKGMDSRQGEQMETFR